ncbi:hypothetical protein GCM10010167_02820 [Paractinoplanes deccanensis]
MDGEGAWWVWVGREGAAELFDAAAHAGQAQAGGSGEGGGWGEGEGWGRVGDLKGDVVGVVADRDGGAALGRVFEDVCQGLLEDAVGGGVGAR